MTTTIEQQIAGMVGEQIVLHSPFGSHPGTLHPSNAHGRYRLQANNKVMVSFHHTMVTKICSKGIHVHLKGS